MSIRFVGFKTQEDFIKQCLCKNCFAIIEYTPNDIRQDERVYLTDSTTENFIMCPVCKRKVLLYTF